MNQNIADHQLKCGLAIEEPVKSFIEFYLGEVNKLEHDHEPPYAKIYAKINDVLKALGHSSATTDHFHLFNPPKKGAKAIAEAKAATVETNGTNSVEAVAVEEKGRGGRKRQAKVAKANPSEDEDSEAEREKPKPKRTPAARKNGVKAAEVVLDSDNEVEAEKPTPGKKS